MTTQQSDSRAAFEATYGTKAYLLGRNAQDDYLEDEIQESWLLWQKAVAWQASQGAAVASPDALQEVVVGVLEIGGIHEGEFECNDIGMLHEPIEAIQQQLVRIGKNMEGVTLMLHAKVPQITEPFMEILEPMHPWYPANASQPG